jgi:hypothetical protein
MERGERERERELKFPVQLSRGINAVAKMKNSLIHLVGSRED